MPRKTYRLQITNEDLLLQINSKNKKLAERFLREKDTRSSDLTIKNYKSDLDIFFVWNLQFNENKFFVDIKKIEFSDFFSYCVNILKWSPSRFSRVKSCLSSFSNFIEKFFDDDYPNFRNVILKVIESMPKNLVREKTILSEEQINNLFEYLKKNNKNQEACWLALAIASGARFSELLRFTTDIIDPKHTAFDGIFIETLKKIKTKGRTKSGKMLNKYIIKDIFIPYYETWLIERKEILDKNNIEHENIFIKNNGIPAKESTIRGWISEFENYLSTPFYPHALRHYSTTYLSRIGIPHQLIKELFGWESIEMVGVYDDMEAKDRKWDELENLKNHLNNN